MWTIQYEFLCYLLVIPLVRSGLALRPAWLAAAALGCLAACRLPGLDAGGPLGGPVFLPAPPSWGLRLLGMFLAGAAFRAFRHRLGFTRLRLLPAAAGLAIALCVPPLVEIGTAAFGGYLIFGVAELGGSTWAGRVNNRNDISYGVYLYAWPVQRLLMRHLGLTDLAPLVLCTWAIAVCMGWASWLLVEKPALGWMRAATRDPTISGQPKGASPVG